MEDEQKIIQLRQLLQSAEASLQSARHILNGLAGDEVATDASAIADQAKALGSVAEEGGNRIINGIFDGQHMIGPDGKQYSVPANYASKSKLVEGDMLKLTIMNDGSFVYKQVGPIDRTRVIGTLQYDDLNEDWKVDVNGRLYNTLLASVTYFKGDAGDEVVLLIPKGKEASWGAVENIIKQGTERPADIEIGDVDMKAPETEHHVDNPLETKPQETDLDDI